ncbi:MAG: CBS domain-containing protein [Acidimicrobiales bacterium]
MTKTGRKGGSADLALAELALITMGNENNHQPPNDQMLESDPLGPEAALGAEPIGSLTGDEIVSMPATATLVEAATTMNEAAVSLVVLGIGDDNKADSIKAVVSERDVVRAVAEGAALDQVAAVDYGSTTLKWALPESAISDVVDEMMSGYVRHVLVADDDGTLVGIVSMRDILAAFSALL